MPSSDFDLQKPNILGGLDKLATHFGIAILAVFPTFLTCLIRPARLRPLIDRIEPEGRKGLLLSPGAFFFIALFVAFIIGALMSTPETLEYNGAYIGPDLAVQVQAAAAEGNIWKLIGTILPLYVAAIVLGLLGTLLKPFADPDWSLQASIRAAFYVMGVLISWAVLVTAVVDRLQVKVGSDKDMSFLYVFALVALITAFLWMYIGFFRHGGTVSWRRSGLLALAMFAIVGGMVFGLNIFLRL